MPRYLCPRATSWSMGSASRVTRSWPGPTTSTFSSSPASIPAASAAAFGMVAWYFRVRRVTPRRRRLTSLAMSKDFTRRVPRQTGLLRRQCRPAGVALDDSFALSEELVQLLIRDFELIEDHIDLAGGEARLRRPPLHELLGEGPAAVLHVHVSHVVGAGRHTSV